jgi:hypothetical protein
MKYPEKFSASGVNARSKNVRATEDAKMAGGNFRHEGDRYPSKIEVPPIEKLGVNMEGPKTQGGSAKSFFTPRIKRKKAQGA